MQIDNIYLCSIRDGESDEPAYHEVSQQRAEPHKRSNTTQHNG